MHGTLLGGLTSTDNSRNIVCEDTKSVSDVPIEELLMIIDPVSDSGFVKLCQLSKVFDLPEFVKQSSLDEQIDTKTLPAISFADSVKRVFPIHTKAAAYLSYLYFLDQRKDMVQTEINRASSGFKKAGSIWNINAEFMLADEEYKKATDIQPAEKVACAIEINGLEFLPINTAANVMSSTREFDDSRNSLPYDLRYKAANALMKAAIDMHLTADMLPECVHKSAGKGLTTKEAATKELCWRIKEEKSAKIKDALKPTADFLDQLDDGIISREAAEKVARTIAAYDEATGLYKNYGKSVPLPEDILFAFTKFAADSMLDTLTEINGTNYRTSDLEAAEVDKLFGTDTLGIFGSDMSKVAKVVSNSPSAAKLFNSALRTKGVKAAKVDTADLVNKTASKAAGRFALSIDFSRKAAEVQEVTDPIMKRAISVFERLKKGVAPKPPKEDTTDNIEYMIVRPRTKGRFLAKAPNKSSTKKVND